MRPGESSDPQAADWGGLSWSPWTDLDQAVRDHLIPATAGLYRFRARDDPGLLYIGEGVNRRRRLRTLARALHRHPASFYLDWRAAGLTRRPHRGHYAAPSLRRCQDAGCVIEVSWAREEHPDRAQRRTKEADLISRHRQYMGGDPPVQHGGRGVDHFLESRRGPQDRGG